MEHSIVTYVPQDTVLSYSWKKSDKWEPTSRLRNFYKSHPGVVRFVKFPLKHRVWLEKHPAFPRHDWFYDHMAAIPSLLSFDAQVWDIDVEAKPHPVREPIHRGRHWYRPKMHYLRQHFVAPFRKSNEALILSAEIPLRIMNCDSALVLLDMCQEQGARLNFDFEFTKRERYIIPKSDDMRLMLADKIGNWPEFDMMFTIAHPEFLEYTITIDDLK